MLSQPFGLKPRLQSRLIEAANRIGLEPEGLGQPSPGQRPGSDVGVIRRTLKECDARRGAPGHPLPVGSPKGSDNLARGNAPGHRRTTRRTLKGCDTDPAQSHTYRSSHSIPCRRRNSRNSSWNVRRAWCRSWSATYAATTGSFDRLTENAPYPVCQ